jgi:hypothetical protein
MAALLSSARDPVRTGSWVPGLLADPGPGELLLAVLLLIMLAVVAVRLVRPRSQRAFGTSPFFTRLAVQASLTGLASHPARYGWNSDVVIQSAGGYAPFNQARSGVWWPGRPR